MKTKIAGIAFLLSLIMACSNKTLVSTALFGPEDNAGKVKKAVFTGNIVSASAENMPAVLKLMSDSTFQAEAMDAKTGEVFISQGRYEVEKRSIILKPDEKGIFPVQYSLSDNRLLLENSELSAEYFEKLNDDLLEKFWILEEIKGKPVKIDADHERIPYILFRYINSTAGGSSGCNRYSSKYEIIKENNIRFSPVLSTKMACLDITYEDEFFRVLRSSNRYEIVNDSLYLKNNDEVVLKFSKSASSSYPGISPVN